MDWILGYWCEFDTRTPEEINQVIFIFRKHEWITGGNCWKSCQSSLLIICSNTNLFPVTLSCNWHNYNAEVGICLSLARWQKQKVWNQFQNFKSNYWCHWMFQSCWVIRVCSLRYCSLLCAWEQSSHTKIYQSCQRHYWLLHAKVSAPPTSP